MECNSLRRSESRRMRAHLLAAGDDFQAASGLTCAVRVVRLDDSDLSVPSLLTGPVAASAPAGIQNSQSCSLFSEPTSQD